MTLNNLHSEAIQQYVNGGFFNMASWGQQISDSYYLSKIYVSIYKAKKIIVLSSFPDFSSPANTTFPSEIEIKRLSQKYSKHTLYFKNFPGKTIGHYYNNQISFSDSTFYTSLIYDSFGGVHLNIPENKIAPNRWNEPFTFPTDYTEKEYQALENFCDWLTENDIQLIFVQTPYKSGYIITETDKRIALQHYETCRNIVEKNRHVYKNYTGRKEFDDETLFADQTHLQERGAKMLTTIIVEDLKLNTNH